MLKLNIANFMLATRNLLGCSLSVTYQFYIETLSLRITYESEDNLAFLT